MEFWDLKYHETLVLICEKCGKKIDSDDNPALAIRGELKNALKKSGEWGKVRVMSTSCLDVCPEKKIAVAFTGDKPGSATEAVTIEPDEGDALLELIRKRIQS